MIEYVKGLHFKYEDIEYLRGLHIFEEDFLEYLAGFHFRRHLGHSGKERSYSREPMLKVVAPIMQAQLVETAVLNMLNHQSLIATKVLRASATRRRVTELWNWLRRAGDRMQAFTAHGRLSSAAASVLPMSSAARCLTFRFSERMPTAGS